jgi:hypothetical protein
MSNRCTSNQTSQLVMIYRHFTFTHMRTRASSTVNERETWSTTHLKLRKLMQCRCPTRKSGDMDSLNSYGTFRM